jgi:hypothetical protein
MTGAAFLPEKSSMVPTPTNSRLMLCLLAGLLLPLATRAPAATITYTVIGSTNDFQGTIDVADLAVSIASFSNINFITATGYGSEPIGFFGTNSNGWVTYLGNNGGQFGFQSPNYYAAFQANQTWNDVIDNSYTITTSEGFNTTFSAPQSPAPNSITSQNGVISFAVVPEPATLTLIVTAGLGLLAARRRWR